MHTVSGAVLERYLSTRTRVTRRVRAEDVYVSASLRRDGSFGEWPGLANKTRPTFERTTSDELPATSYFPGGLNPRSTASFGSVDTGWSRHSQRIISGRIGPPMRWPCVFIPHV